MARFAMVTGATKTPNAPRNTVLPLKTSGVQAKPTRGLTMWELF